MGCSAVSPWDFGRPEGSRGTRGHVMPDQDSPMLSSSSPEPALAVTRPPCHQEGKGTHVGSPMCSGACWCPHKWQGARSAVGRREWWVGGSVNHFRGTALLPSPAHGNRGTADPLLPAQHSQEHSSAAPQQLPAHPAPCPTSPSGRGTSSGCS